MRLFTQIPEILKSNKIPDVYPGQHVYVPKNKLDPDGIHYRENLRMCEILNKREGEEKQREREREKVTGSRMPMNYDLELRVKHERARSEEIIS